MIGEPASLRAFEPRARDPDFVRRRARNFRAQRASGFHELAARAATGSDGLRCDSLSGWYILYGFDMTCWNVRDITPIEP